ncbi:adenylate kinase [Caballeronia arationis]|uniref:hypothetical protein n=1 Tax=Caballeronia arationis TaxID=1777142 RepID=UPI00074CAEAC|nr:hypothetical protein [Caballeronia arationis]SAL04739.1 adenylate kinase [Caballeronia arationis]
MSGRRVHAASGRTYHFRLHPPKVDNDDDLSGPLIQRDDDQEATVARRLDVYIAQTRLLIEY